MELLNERPYSEICGYVLSRISISLMRAASHCLRGARDPTARISTATWETGKRACPYIANLTLPANNTPTARLPHYYSSTLLTHGELHLLLHDCLHTAQHCHGPPRHHAPSMP